ncbi:MAG: helix-turn-helix transcriptional regulator [Patescibacteria group bacterium]
MSRKIYTFEDDLKYRLKNPSFRKAWEKSEVEYLVSKALIEKRLARRMSQRALAKKAKTTQAVISRIEGMSANPSINLLKKIAAVFDSKLKISFS